MDEIGNIPPGLQAKLLSAIQNHEIYPLGSSKAVKTDIRLITATNLPVEEIMESRQFRKDLLYRINTILIEIPPLRKRREDIPVLAQFFLKKHSEHYGKPGLKISETTLNQLMEHDWPGNIRELQHQIEKAVILSEGKDLQISDFFSSEKVSTGLMAHHSYNLEENEKWLITQALREFDGNISHTAKKLGIDRSTLYAKMKKYEIKQV
jgi:transcriptional regulator with PAS, ATPase and Fis domain